MKILVYSGLYEGMGSGNVLRGLVLADEISKRNNIEVTISSNNIYGANNLTKVMKSKRIYREIDYDSFDGVIYDSPYYDSEIVKRLREKSKVIVALDFFMYKTKDVDIIINLVNHNKEKVSNFCGSNYEGVDYAIIKDEILRLKTGTSKVNEKPRVLITFGGEDPNSNTLMTLEKLDFQTLDIIVICGALFKDKELIYEKYEKKITIIEPTPKIGELIKDSDLIICGGGTTLLESIYLGNPIVAIAQNANEQNFINKVKEKIRIFDINKIEYIVSKYRNEEFRKNIKNEYQSCVDGKGRKRIVDILLEQIGE